MYQATLCTCPDLETANNISKLIIENKLAACVNILPDITSIYSWQGKVEKDSEVLLLIKGISANFEKLSLLISEYHPYEVPELIALDIQKGNDQFFKWIDEVVK
ncbi:divalent-cation tolerance protein CutA [Pseudoalteromonas sp. NBT06-2]|uniref:divalent-cation tolerance protein CutA n=1 Tax=Pseudoalteromonas sp. NBT06-2 TaxID=2025950 RepID=UPI000BA637AD|nr:divalent-cation tolerance protein CutA [Pseudoalteromonas sp. NBT06-2]PAJ74558.1 divalent-cation tolerance protein CutA [Pseudoalteromonas sp. NBT06-2]